LADFALGGAEVSTVQARALLRIVQGPGAAARRLSMNAQGSVKNK
jgi:hypothetical protein